MKLEVNSDASAHTTHAYAHEPEARAVKESPLKALTFYQQELKKVLPEEIFNYALKLGKETQFLKSKFILSLWYWLLMSFNRNKSFLNGWHCIKVLSFFML